MDWRTRYLPPGYHHLAWRAAFLAALASLSLTVHQCCQSMSLTSEVVVHFLLLELVQDSTLALLNLINHLQGTLDGAGAEVVSTAVVGAERLHVLVELIVEVRVRLRNATTALAGDLGGDGEGSHAGLVVEGVAGLQRRTEGAG